MGFNKLKLSLLIRTTLLVASVLISVFLLLTNENRFYLTGGFIFIFLLFYQVHELYNFISATNRKLSRFLQSIHYSDFSQKFTSDDQMDKSYQNLNIAFNKVVDAFKTQRVEKEESLQYLKTVVKHVGTGLIAYNLEGDIELVNENAKEYLKLRHIRNINELNTINPEFFSVLRDLKPGKSTLFREGENMCIKVNATSLRVKNKPVKLIALQNIYPELQQMELESWQNLAKVLRHEIMNSIAPISSLNSTILQVLKEDVLKEKNQYILQEASFKDLITGLNTIANRTKGLISFVSAYQVYTNIPKPSLRHFSVQKFFDGLSILLKADLRNSKTNFKHTIESDDIYIYGDFELLEMVLLNLIKNALESNLENDNLNIWLVCRRETKGNLIIEVIDDGFGMSPEILDKIFIPFYSTKKTGTGIGLSLSKQIMQLHHGSLSVKSEMNVKTIFTLRI